MPIASVRTDFPNNSHYSQIVIAARQQVMLTYYALHHEPLTKGG